MSKNTIDILLADYANSQHAEALVQLMDEYARDPYGGGEPLSETCREQLVPKLAAFPGAFSVLAFDDSTALGLVNCFTGFSTFACKPLVNIHDVIVTGEARGRGVCGQMLELVAEEAKRRGCCKLTMEVLEKNRPAQRAYRKVGFEPYVLDENMGAAHFWQRYL